jgi:hypothetical protein
MLSWMYCEKLKVMPGNSAANCFCTSSTSFSLVMPGFHSSNGFKGTKNSALLKPEASLPLSGRPCCETTVMVSGCESRISRIRVTDGIAASSEMVGGIDARIHRLPSSSAGRNSVPRRGASIAVKMRNAIPNATISLRWVSEKCRAGE